MAKKRNNRKRIDGYIPQNKDLQTKIKSLNIEELGEIKNVDFRFKKLILKFANFLRDEDFSISTDALLKFFKLYKSFDIFELEDMRLSLKMLLVKNKEQYDTFDEYFAMFFNALTEQFIESNIDDLSKQAFEELAMSIEMEKKNATKELEEKMSELSSMQSEINEEVENEINKTNQEKLEMKNEYMEKEFQYRRRKEEGEEELKEWVENKTEKLESLFSQSTLSEQQKSEMRTLMSLSQNDIINHLKDNTYAKFESLKNSLNEVMLNNMIGENDEKINELCLVSSNMLMKLKDFTDKKNKEFQDELSELDKKIRQEKERVQSINSEIKNTSRELSAKVSAFDSRLNNLNRDIKKEISKAHRVEFTNGKNSVRTTTNKDLLNSDIEKLGNSDYESLTDIIKANATVFRTRISRSMIRHKSKKFNYSKTMEESLKTFGVPFELCYEKPKVKKTKIICILDVSGSCSKSSKLLLRFIHELSGVFKGGVKSYAFVKDLVDISDFFVDYHINDAIEYSLSSVPRTYSDYHHALRTFNELYLGEVTKDTIVLFLGDARNNKNPSGIEYLEAINKKAKSVLWLNTEEEPKWNVNDSIIGLYSEYTDEVYEVLTTNHLVKFLENIKIG